MATRFYLNNNQPPFIPATTKGAWDKIGNTLAVMMGTNKFGDNITSVSSFETVATAPYSVLVFRGVSSRLTAQTIAGYLDVILGVNEQDPAAEFFYHLHAWVTQGNTDVVRGTLLNNYTETSTNEWRRNFFPNGQASALQFAAPLNPVNALLGDRIVIEFGFVARNIVTTQWDGTYWYGTNFSVTRNEAPDLALNDLQVDSKAGCIDFTQTILFDPVFQETGHVVLQAIEDVPPPKVEFAHMQVQHIALTKPATEIIHIILQVVEGKQPPLQDISGIYFINPAKTFKHDSYYGSVERKIPDPTIRTALLGE